MPFSALGLSPSLCTPLARKGYDRPTPVQAESIPIVLSGRDLLARAQTGTGKTAAFALPMVDRLLLRATRTVHSRKPRGLVLVPTRELALQVHKALEGKVPVGAPKMVFLPKSTVQLSGDAAEKVLRLIEHLEENDDVQHVWSNFDISEKEIEASLA